MIIVSYIYAGQRFYYISTSYTNSYAKKFLTDFVTASIEILLNKAVESYVKTKRR